MHLVCQHDHDHCHLEGSAPGYGARTAYMENYQPGMPATLAAAKIMQPEEPHHWEAAHAASSAKDAGRLVKLHTEHKADALRTVQRLHRNLGHPSADALADLLAARGAHPNVIEAARKYQCVARSKYKKPNEAAPASMPLARRFNDTVQADVCKSTNIQYLDCRRSHQVHLPIPWTMRPPTPMSRLWKRCGCATSAHQSSW